MGGKIIQCPAVPQIISPLYICVIPPQSIWSPHRCGVEKNLAHRHMVLKGHEILITRMGGSFFFGLTIKPILLFFDWQKKLLRIRETVTNIHQDGERDPTN